MHMDVLVPVWNTDPPMASFEKFFVFRSKRVDKLPGWSLRSGTFEHNHRAWLGANIVVVGFVSWLISPKI